MDLGLQFEGAGEKSSGPPCRVDPKRHGVCISHAGLGRIRLCDWDALMMFSLGLPSHQPLLCNAFLEEPPNLNYPCACPPHCEGPVRIRQPIPSTFRLRPQVISCQS